MATNPYSYGSLGSRWTVGEPTSKSLLDISRVKNDANRWTLEQLIPDPDTTQTLGFDLSFNSSDQRLLQIYNTDASNYFQIFGGQAATPTSDHLVFSTGTNGTIMAFDGLNHWITFHDTAGVQKMYYRGDGSPGLILESGVDLTVGGDVAVNGDTLFVDASADRVGINTATPGAALDVAHTGTSAAFRVYNSQATNPFGILIDNTGANLSDSNYVADFRVGGYSILKLNNSGQMTFAPNSYGGVSAGNLTVKTGSINSDSIRLEAGGTTSTWLESRGYLGHSWYVDSTRSMTLDSTGLGVGTDSPESKLHVETTSGGGVIQIGRDTGAAQYQYINFGGNVAGDDAWQVGRSSNSGGLGGNGAFYIYDLKNSATRLSVDTSGNMGLGVTPSAWHSSYRALQVNDSVLYNDGAGNTFVGSNFYWDGSNYKYINTDYAPAYGQVSGEHRWYTAASGTAGNNVSFTQAMTLTNAGLLGLGTVSPSTLLQLNETYGTAALSISDDSSAGDYITFQIVGGQYNGGVNEIQAINTTDLSLNAYSARSLIFKTNNTERARILSSGGITFNGDTAAANALDDYEEGTYSVTDQSGAGLSFTVNSNRYVKIGKLVFISIEFFFPTTSDGTSARISLPFANSTAQRGAMSVVTNRSDVQLGAYVSTLSSAFSLSESAASPASVTNASLSGKYLIISGCYEATA